jgi:hypothetical protein
MDVRTATGQGDHPRRTLRGARHRGDVREGLVGKFSKLGVMKVQRADWVHVMPAGGTKLTVISVPLVENLVPLLAYGKSKTPS